MVRRRRLLLLRWWPWRGHGAVEEQLAHFLPVLALGGRGRRGPPKEGGLGRGAGGVAGGGGEVQHRGHGPRGRVQLLQVVGGGGRPYPRGRHAMLLLLVVVMMELTVLGRHHRQARPAAAVAGRHGPRQRDGCRVDPKSRGSGGRRRSSRGGGWRGERSKYELRAQGRWRGAAGVIERLMVVVVQMGRRLLSVSVVTSRRSVHVGGCRHDAVARPRRRRRRRARPWGPAEQHQPGGSMVGQAGSWRLVVLGGPARTTGVGLAQQVEPRTPADGNSAAGGAGVSRPSAGPGAGGLSTDTSVTASPTWHTAPDDRSAPATTPT